MTELMYVRSTNFTAPEVKKIIRKIPAKKQSRQRGLKVAASGWLFHAAYEEEQQWCLKTF